LAFLWSARGIWFDKALCSSSYIPSRTTGATSIAIQQFIFDPDRFLWGERRWVVIVLFAVAGSFGVYYVFTTWLDVLLPSGVLGS
jgi:hypothetical protein